MTEPEAPHPDRWPANWYVVLHRQTYPRGRRIMCAHVFARGARACARAQGGYPAGYGILSAAQVNAGH